MADSLSRGFSSNLEWSLDVDIFNQLTSNTFIPYIDLIASRLNPIQTGLFWAFWDRGEGGGIGGPFPPVNSENIKAVTRKPRGQRVRPKKFPLRTATTADGAV